MQRALLPVLLLGLCAAARAGDHDDVPLYVGTWTMRLAGGDAARLVVQDWEGTWQGRGAKPACGGRKVPITVHHSNPTEFEFTAWGSTVSPPCPDVSFSVKPVDRRTLEGTTGTGVKVTMTRAARR